MSIVQFDSERVQGQIVAASLNTYEPSLELLFTEELLLADDGECNPTGFMCDQLRHTVYYSFMSTEAKKASLENQQPHHSYQHLPFQQIYNPGYGYLSYPPPPLPSRYAPAAQGVPITATLVANEKKLPNYQQTQGLNQQHQQPVTGTQHGNLDQPQNQQENQSVLAQGEALPKNTDNGAEQQANVASLTNYTTASQANYGYSPCPPPPPPPRYAFQASGIPNTASQTPNDQKLTNYQQTLLNQQHKLPVRGTQQHNTTGQIPQQTLSGVAPGEALPKKKDNEANQQQNFASDPNQTMAFPTNYGYLTYPPPPPPPIYVPPASGVPNTTAHLPYNQQTQQSSSIKQDQFHTQEQNEKQNQSFSTQVLVPDKKNDNGATLQATVAAPTNHTTAPQAAGQHQTNTAVQNGTQAQPTFYGQYPGYYTHLPVYRQPHNYLPQSHQQHGTNQTGFFNGNFVPNFPPPNVTAWNQNQQPGYASSAHQFVPSSSTGVGYSQSYPTASVNMGVNQPSGVSSAAISGQSLGSSGGVGYYTAGSNNYAMRFQQPPSNVTNGSVPGSSGFVGATPYTPQASTIQNGTNPTNNQPNTQTNVNYFSGEGIGQGMYATQITEDENEQKRRLMALYENEKLQRIYLNEGITHRLVINPNVNIEAQLNREYLQQYLQGANPDEQTMERMYGSVNINSAGQSHNITQFEVTNTSDSSGFLPTDNSAQPIQNASYMRPPPPYPVAQVNRLAIDSARNEARNAEAELSASKERRKKAEEKIIATEVSKRKAKARSHRMSSNQREAYLRFEYNGRATRNTQNYMNTSDVGMEEYMMQLELEEARNAELRAAEKMTAANNMLKAQLEEASRIEAAQTPHPLPAYGRNFSTGGGPIRQPNKRGRRPQKSQTAGRSNASVQAYGNPSPMQPPSYPGAIRSSSRSQQYKTPGTPYQMPKMGRNPPDYYQAVGSSPSQYPRHMTVTTYGPGSSKCHLPNCNIDNQFMAAAAHAPRKQVPQVSALSAGLQQYHYGPQGIKHDTVQAQPVLRGQNNQIPNDPASNLYKAPTAFPVRQTRSATRMFGEEYFNNRTPLAGQDSRMTSKTPNLTGSFYTPTQFGSTAAGAPLSTSQSPASTSSFVMGSAVTQPGNKKQGATHAPKLHSERAEPIDIDNIENLVPTLPAIPNTLFERCLKDMTPEVPKENQRKTCRMEAVIHCNAPFSSSSSGVGTSQPSATGGRVQTHGPSSGLSEPHPSATHPYACVETQPTAQNQNEEPARAIFEKELDQFFQEHAKNLQGQIVDDDFSSEFDELLKQVDDKGEK